VIKSIKECYSPFGQQSNFHSCVGTQFDEEGYKCQTIDLAPHCLTVSIKHDAYFSRFDPDWLSFAT
jgi:hypothetical protein